MAKDKPQPQAGPELAEYVTTAKPKAYADGVPVAPGAEDVVGDLRGLAVFALGADAAGRLLCLLLTAGAVGRVGQQDLGLCPVQQ